MMMKGSFALRSAARTWVLFGTILILFVSSLAGAAEWVPIENSRSGRGTGVCSEESLDEPEYVGHYYCFGLRCGKGRGTEFVVFFSGGMFRASEPAGIMVDGELQMPRTFAAVDRTSEYVSPFDPVADEDFLSNLMTGSTLVIWMGGKPEMLPLEGAAAQIRQTLLMCR